MERLNPDTLLTQITAEENRARRGRLRIFFGGCAGTGKTYAMLATGRERQKEGIDVVIGLIETHGRPDTAKMAEAFPVIEPLNIQHKDISIREFDLDAALARKPALILLDELAHTNAPRMRHPKRWQDVEELLNAGIDVYTSLNVQHLESLNDVVLSITGVRVAETVPDRVFDEADDITLVDIPTDELLKRLKEGKVYIQQGAKDRAALNFFKKNNLIALRELALRRTAERVDAQWGDYQTREGIREGGSVTEKILVCIGSDALSLKLVRSTRRMAGALKCGWAAIYIENARHHRLNEHGKKAVQRVMQAVERIGGKMIVLSGNDAVEEILAYARQHKYTRIVVGQTIRPRWRTFLTGTLSESLIRKSGALDIHVVTADSTLTPDSTFPRIWPQSPLRNYGYSVVITALVTLFCYLLEPWLDAPDFILLYILGTVGLASRYGRGPSMLYALLSVTALNFFFIEPRYTLRIYDSSYFITFAVMLVTSLVITQMSYRLRWQALFSRRRERETDALYALARELSSTRGKENIIATVSRNIQELFNANTTIWMPDTQEMLETLYDKPQGINEENAARWCFENHQPAGLGTNTMPNAKGFYLPLISGTDTLGVLGITPQSGAGLDTEQVQMLQTFATILAAALERAHNADRAEQARVEIEAERLRSILLSTVSHDLRTPLTSISGAASSLLSEGKSLPEKTRSELATSILDESNRLSRLVSNLLDITRLESGGIHLKKQPYYIDELIGSALLHTQKILENHFVRSKVAEKLPMVEVDGLLIEQLLINLLENAARYTPTGSIIAVEALPNYEMVEVRVEDNGQGIPSGDEEKIFEKFYTVSKTDKHRGTGLGLAICKGIVTAHGGTITANNRTEGGACFSFTLPIAKIPVELNDV